MHISAHFDAGNIDVLDATDPSNVRLAIRDDVGGEHKQWFHFRAAGVRGQPCVFRVENAGLCSYPKGWEGYRAVASTDRQRWFRVPTRFEGGALIIEHTPEADAVWYAYFAPYSQERHHDLIARSAQSPFVRHEVLGASIDGRDLDLLVVGEPGVGKRVVWVIARQHPGESMAEWWMEGFLARLLDPHDAIARRARDGAVFYVVPNMNPDGSARGHLRTNAVGANLNREWHEPTLARAPEVKHVRDRMDATGLDLAFDVHGDEALPYNFIAGAEGIAGWTPRLAALQDAFEAAYERACPDFQRVHGYPKDAPRSGNMTMHTNQIAARFDALAMTLEMPFKDNADAPDAEAGWSPERCVRLGAAALDPMVAVLPILR
jgi:murein tripeptide amidase MpaA